MTGKICCHKALRKNAADKSPSPPSSRKGRRENVSGHGGAQKGASSKPIRDAERSGAPATACCGHEKRSGRHAARENTGLFPRDRAAWPAGEALFPPLNEAVCRDLKAFIKVLHAVRPLSAAHRRFLPDDIAALSRVLTFERANLVRPYWSKPNFISAYLYYFLPWNLVRFVRLLSALPLQFPEDSGKRLLLVDIGSGPLTLPIALWLARPDLRDAPIRVLAQDKASQPLAFGRALFEELARLEGKSAWQVETIHSPLSSLHRQVRMLCGDGAKGGACGAWLVTAANVLNEYCNGRPQKMRGGNCEDFARDGGVGESLADENVSGAMEAALEDVLEAILPMLAASSSLSSGEESGAAGSAPAALFIEPGTRLGGKLIMRMRALAIQAGLNVLAPCTHSTSCPLLEGRGGRTWCHYTFDEAGAPLWLRKLSAEAGLSKAALSLAPVLLSPHSLAPDAGSHARVISSPFVVPGLPGKARYACSHKGLVLLEDALALASGVRLPISIPAGAKRDAKSRAPVIPAPRAARRELFGERRPHG